MKLDRLYLVAGQQLAIGVALIVACVLYLPLAVVRGIAGGVFVAWEAIVDE